MLFRLLSLVCLGTVSLAVPIDQLDKRATISPDASCGGTKGGSTSAYCGAGCQAQFGSCTGGPTASPTTSKTLPPTSTPTAGTLSDCLAKKNVPIRLASSSDFSQLAQSYNLRLPYTPAVIVLPETTQHVSDAVPGRAKR
ncbi:MAG: hypothetical protein L6R39_005908 [Caloplaca ligustica]|nr:MAG: hypothetical protein L6R39_005908 [Caloplaca ligustica]